MDANHVASSSSKGVVVHSFQLVDHFLFDVLGGSSLKLNSTIVSIREMSSMCSSMIGVGDKISRLHS